MPATTRPERRPDVQEMVVVHRAFRREAGAAAGCTRSAPESDALRAKVVGAAVSQSAKAPAG